MKKNNFSQLNILDLACGTHMLSLSCEKYDLFVGLCGKELDSFR